MPRIEKIFSLEITPEQFINNCSDIELQELGYLLENKINALKGNIVINKTNFKIKNYTKEQKNLLDAVALLYKHNLINIVMFKRLNIEITELCKILGVEK